MRDGANENSDPAEVEESPPSADADRARRSVLMIGVAFIVPILCMCLAIVLFVAL